MKKTSDISLAIICFLLILLWVYAAVSKVLDFSLFRLQMQRQVLPLFLKESLIYILPVTEVVAALLLLFEVTLRQGLYLSAILMGVFTIYVGLAVFKVFHNVPCACGGIIAAMGWHVHFVFNIFFLLLATLGIYQVHRERRPHSEN